METPGLSLINPRCTRRKAGSNRQPLSQVHGSAGVVEALLLPVITMQLVTTTATN